MLDFYIDFDEMSEVAFNELNRLGSELMESYKANSIFKTCNYSTGVVEYHEYYPKKSKAIIDEIDRVLGKYYDLDETEIEFIINYNLRFRMGEESEEVDE